ncbi:hypothetical protein ACFVAD_20555 [Sutcliffiella sp. NPDC057660]|uniref:hypothetical protein n=1 Tax=Sutcliffiella sp. NPDC057660 TaxID=3346199 RepID=UPI0036C74EC8
MFKITVFSPIPPVEIGPLLKGFRFTEVKNEFVWKVDGYVFRIVPFGTQGRAQTAYGYRVFFNGSIDGGQYLFDLSMGCFTPTINAVEFDLTHPTMKQSDWISDMLRRPSYKTGQLRGIFEKGNVKIVCLPNDVVNLQLRKNHSRVVKLPVFLKEVEMIRDDLLPVEYDLFSSFEEGIAI